MHVHDTIDRFDRYLAERGIRFEAVVIGGAALNLIGAVTRPTGDCDVMHPELPDTVLAAAQGFAEQERAAGRELDPDWLNAGPSLVKDHLPGGWEQRLQPAYSGSAIILQTLGRLDLLRTKVFAYCDRSVDLEDCIALGPTRAELNEIRPWLEQQDGNPAWPDHVRARITDLTMEIEQGDMPDLTPSEIIARVVALRRVAARDPRQLNESQMCERAEARKELEQLEPRYREAETLLKENLHKDRGPEHER
ncbi:MAG: DUF6036 family nucleotidyltransferase [Myxococcota bacterium]